MYACKQCGTGNPLDSSFCKKCGAALPETELADARVKLNEMLEEGNNLFTDGRTDEAMLIAEAAVAANPSSHMAYSLKGLCHERVGQISEALECYETAVGLNPDSSLDKVKVAALRNRLAQRVADAPAPSRRSAAVMALSAMAIVLVLGCLVAIGMNGRHETPKVASNPPASQPQTPADFVTPQQNASPPPQSTAGSNTGAGTGTASGSQGSGYYPPAAFDPGPIPGLQDYPRGGLPPAVGTSGSLTTVPLHPPGPDTEPAPKNVETPAGPPPEVLKTPDTVTTPPEDPPYIHVEHSRVNTPGIPHGSQDANDGHEVATVLQAAQQSYQLGHYDQAASKYAKVAEMGGNSGRVQQRLGDCYRNLSKNEQARSAYNHAIVMYQSQIKLGHDVAGNQRGLDSCESALKVLGG